MELLQESLIFGLCVLPVLVIALTASRPRYAFTAFFFLFLLMLDDFLTGLPLVYEILSIPEANWNWIGKSFSLALSLSIIGTSEYSFKDIGLTVKQRVGSVLPASVLTILLIGVSLFLGYEFTDGTKSSTEAVLYRLTMPGFAEELAYRGLFLALLHQAMPARPRTFTYWLPAIITTIAFGLWHGVQVEPDWQVSFDFLAFILPFFAGAAFVWMRERTGSLLFPIVAHNGSFAAFFFAHDLMNLLN